MWKHFGYQLPIKTEPEEMELHQQFIFLGNGCLGLG